MPKTIRLTGKSTELSFDVLPPEQLDGNWEIGLIYFYTYNSVPNIDVQNNTFYYNDK